MGFTEVLTIIFVLLKVFGVVTWSWWIVFAPELAAIVLYLVLVIFGVRTTSKTTKKINKEFNDKFFK